MWQMLVIVSDSDDRGLFEICVRGGNRRGVE
jgi:hypothetical protein